MRTFKLIHSYPRKVETATSEDSADSQLVKVVAVPAMDFPLPMRGSDA